MLGRDRGHGTQDLCSNVMAHACAGYSRMHSFTDSPFHIHMRVGHPPRWTLASTPTPPSSPAEPSPRRPDPQARTALQQNCLVSNPAKPLIAANRFHPGIQAVSRRRACIRGSAKLARQQGDEPPGKQISPAWALSLGLLQEKMKE